MVNQHIESQFTPINHIEYGKDIPKNVYQSWKTKKLPNNMKNNVDKLKSLNKEFTFHLYDDKMCRHFIKDNFNLFVLNCFDKLKPGAFKSDLWRLCILYIKGGIYIDIKMNCIGNFKLIELIDNEYFVKDLPNGDHPYKGIFNGFMVCRKGNLFIKYCIQYLCYNVMISYYGNGCLEVTGPLLLGKVNYYKKFNVPLNLIHVFTTNRQYHNRQITKDGVPILICGYKEYQSECSIHYSEMYKNKQVYNNINVSDVQVRRISDERERIKFIRSERINAERERIKFIRSERINAERINAERINAERINAERINAERVGSVRSKRERLSSSCDSKNIKKIKITVCLCVINGEKYINYLNKFFRIIEKKYSNNYIFEYFFYENNSNDNTINSLKRFFSSHKGKFFTQKINNHKIMSGIDIKRGKQMADVRNYLKNKHGKLNSDYVLIMDKDIVFLPNAIEKMIDTLKNNAMVTSYVIDYSIKKRDQSFNHYYDSFAVITNKNIKYNMTNNTCLFKRCKRCINFRNRNNINLNQNYLLDENDPIIKVKSAFGSMAMLKTNIYNIVSWDGTICEHYSFCDKVRKHGNIVINTNIKTFMNDTSDSYKMVEKYLI